MNNRIYVIETKFTYFAYALALTIVLISRVLVFTISEMTDVSPLTVKMQLNIISIFIVLLRSTFIF